MTDEQETSQEGKETEEQAVKSGEEETRTKLDEAAITADSMKRENDRKEALIEREENLAARKMVGGEAEAGAESKPKVETDEEYSDKFQAGEVNPFKDA